jgi:hypothetical protein
MIGELYDIERQIGYELPKRRRWDRAASKLKALDFFTWAEDVLSKASARAPLTEALRYAMKLNPALLAYTEDGRLEIDNNLAENALRVIAVGTKTGSSPVPIAEVSARRLSTHCWKPPSSTA